MSSTSSVATVVMPTMADLFKEYIVKMPDNLDTKKEIDEYIKIGLKEIVEARKAEEKVKKAEEKALEKAKKTKEKETTVPKKRGAKKEKDVDDDGNEVEKVKKPLSPYLMFMNSHQSKVKNAIEGLKQNQLFSEVAKFWKIYKEFVIEKKEEVAVLDEEEGREKLAELWNIRFEELIEERKKEVEAVEAEKTEVETDEEEKKETEAVEAEKSEDEEEKKEKKTEKKKKEKKEKKEIEEIEEEVETEKKKDKTEKKKKEKKGVKRASS